MGEDHPPSKADRPGSGGGAGSQRPDTVRGDRSATPSDAESAAPAGRLRCRSCGAVMERSGRAIWACPQRALHRLL